MLVCGRNVAKEILKSSKKINCLYLQDSFNDFEIEKLIKKSNLEVKVLQKREIDKLVKDNHQGIVLDIADYSCLNLNQVDLNSLEKVIILDHLEDPHNFGAIIRTSEAAGLDAIIIPKDRQVQINSTVFKTSVGAILNTKIISVSNLNQTISKLKDNNFWIVGTDMNGTDYKQIDYNGKIALVVGNEGKGLSEMVKKNCDFIASIPMYGEINSLNASVAAGIMIYELVRKRK